MARHRRSQLAVLVSLLLILAGCVERPSSQGHERFVWLAWDAPTTNEDGSALLDLAGYRVYQATEGDSYPPEATVDTEALRAEVFTFYPITRFVVTAYDEYGNESKHSEELIIEP